MQRYAPRRTGSAAMADHSECTLDRFDERPFLAQDEPALGRVGEVRAPVRIGLQSSSIGLVRRKGLEPDESPGDVVGPLVRQEIAEQRSAAAGNDAAPGFRVGPERLALEGIDLV